MIEELPKDIHFQGEVGVIIPPQGKTSVYVKLFIEGEPEPIYCLYDQRPNFSDHGPATEAQTADLAFQQFIKKGNFTNIRQEGARKILELYANEKTQGLPWEDLTYRFRRVIPSDEESKKLQPLGEPDRLLRFRLTTDKEGLPI